MAAQDAIRAFDPNLIRVTSTSQLALESIQSSLRTVVHVCIEVSIPMVVTPYETQLCIYSY